MRQVPGVKALNAVVHVQVLSSDVGEVIEARLELLVSLVAYLLQAEINQSVLKDGFPLPDIPHVHFVDLDLAFVKYAVKLAANVCSIVP